MLDIDSYLSILFENLQVTGSYLYLIRHLSAKQDCRFAMYLNVKLADTNQAKQKWNDYGICSIGAFLIKCLQESNEIFQDTE